MELSDLLAALKRYWAPIVLVPVLTVALVWMARPVATYKAQVEVQLLPSGGAANLSQQAVSLLIPAVVAHVDAPAFYNSVAATLPSGVADMPVKVVASGDTTSGLVTISATSRAREAVDPWVNAYAGMVVSDPGSVDGYAVLRPVAPAGPAAVANTHESAIMTGAGLAALLLTVLAVLGFSAVRLQRADGDRRRKLLGAPLVGSIPPARSPGSRRGSAPVLAGTKDLRALAVEVGLSRERHRFNALAVVSDTRGTGCSAVATALARTMAGTEQSVVVIDADGEGSTQAINLGVRWPVPRGRVKIDGMAGLYYAGALERHGPPPTVTGIRSRLEAALTGLPGALVIVDTPPLGDGPEAELVAAAAGSALVVVSGRRTDAAAVRRCVSRLSSRGVTVVGVAVNRKPLLRRSRAKRSWEGLVSVRPVMLGDADGEPAAALSRSVGDD